MTVELRTITWIDGWYTTAVNDKIKSEILNRYPEAVIVPIGVQSLAWKSQRDYNEDKGLKNYIASVI